MTDLRQALIALIRGNGDRDAALAALERALHDAPERRADVLRLLQGAHKAGLEADDYRALSAAVQASAENVAPAAADPDRTMLATEDSDATVLAADADATVLAGGDEDATDVNAVAADSAATEINLPADDDDATEVNLTADDDDDATEVNLPADDDDATEVNIAGADDDATLINLADDDATEISTTSGGAPTETGHGDDDATQVNPGDDDATTVGDAAGGFDILDPDAMAAAEASTEGASTGASWPTAVSSTGPVAGVDREFREGDLLRGRFELISKLGEGGMGAVWKGKDKLKEEARDRNPFVAIKLLQGDFKQHPEAFIALQRETAKQQRLAHPNIATVYDFDRDENTGTVFMTMEVMEGQPLDAFVRKLPAEGLPEEDAMSLIEDICGGLAYAHKAGLVHSDLKPGNAFLVTDPDYKLGRVKLLDFGIARASKTQTDASGETTLFDPGQLGALTPTYATIEMFDGQDPDPRDDIYALAIMAYQLLTAKHPYGKKPAPKARELGLKVEPVGKLDKRQNRGLAHGLAFLRADRTPSVEVFLDEVHKRKSRTGAYVGGAVAALVLIGALAFNPVIDFLDQRKREEVIAELVQPGIDHLRTGLESAAALGDKQLALVLDDERARNAVVAQIARGDQQSIDDALATIAPYDDKWEQEIRDDPRARDAIVGLYETAIQNAFDPDANRFDYAKASAAIASLDQLYPDSATVLRLRNDLKSRRDSKLVELRDKYNTLLDEGRLIPVKGEEDIGDVLAVVAKIDTANSLLEDKRLRLRFIEVAEQAVGERQYDVAKSYLDASVAYAPDDPTLANLRYQVDTELTRIANERLVAGIERRLRAEMGSFRSLADFQKVRDDLIKLSDLSPASPVLVQIRNSLETAFSTALDGAIGAARFADGETLLADFAKLLTVPYVTGKRALLSQAESDGGYQPSADPARAAAVKERVKAVRAMLAKPEFTSDWEIQLKLPFKELIALLPAGDPALEPVRRETAGLYVERAGAAREAGRFDEALAFVNKGRVFYPELPDFAREEQAVADAQEALRLKLEEERRLARIEAQKADLVSKAEANQPKEAKAILETLRGALPADDEFLVKTGPLAVAEAYLRLAQAQAEQQKFGVALDLARLGQELAPDLAALGDAAKTYQAEVKKRALEIDLRKRFSSADPIDAKTTRAALAKLQKDFPQRYPALLKEYAEARAGRIVGLAEKSDVATVGARLAGYKALFPDRHGAVAGRAAGVIERRLRAVKLDDRKAVAALAAPLASYAKAFPKRSGKLVGELSATAARSVRALEKRDKVRASDLLAAARKTFPGAADLKSIHISLPMPEIVDAQRKLDAAQLTAARARLAAAKKKDARHADLPALDKAIEGAAARAEDQYRKYAAAAAKAKYAERKKYDAMYASIAKLWTDRKPGFKRISIRKPRKGECNATLAGYGARSQGVCYDLIGRKRGPMMVVVPAGGGAGMFAIGKYEVSGAEFGAFCKATKRCKAPPRKSARLPATGISLADAEAYAKWLSTEASKTEGEKVAYRLPTEKEWEYAAKAGGKQPGRSFNCRVTSGGKVIAGFDLVSARSGKTNGWGLVNYIGNAREWVRAGSGVTARGGSFEDPLTKCGIQMSEPHGGSADPVTGFRLVRDLG